LEKALQELDKLQSQKPTKTKNARPTSVSDPEARVMRHFDGGLALSYNAQISTDAAHGLIVGVEVTQAANDSSQLLPAVERIEQRLKLKPQQMVADGSYSTREAIEEMAKREIDFLGSMGREQMASGGSTPHRLPPGAFVYQPETNRYVCPEGKLLRSDGRHRKKPGLLYYRYRAKSTDCQNCIRKSECCPGNQSQGRTVLRMVESAAVLAFRQKMASGSVSTAQQSGGVLPRVDQKQAGPAAVSCARLGESSDGDVVGLPDLQFAAVDSSPQAATGSCHELKKESKQPDFPSHSRNQSTEQLTPDLFIWRSCHQVFSQLQSSRMGHPKFKAKAGPPAHWLVSSY
jgi:hypothetical protein